MENSAEFYYEKLKKDSNPGVILASLYCSLYDIKVTRSEIIMCNKLIKTFGRFIVFFAILDTYGSRPERIEAPYPYIYEVCKRRFESVHIDSSLQSREPLTKYLDSIDEQIEQLKKSRRKVVIPSSEGLE